jgi:hypothetical protein
MKHFTVESFWKEYDLLKPEIQETADKNYELLKENPKHPSLHFKKIGRFYSVRVGTKYRALGVETEDKAGVIWFWIGHHDRYDLLIKKAH